MTRGLAGALALGALVAGCASRDLCEGYTEACVGLRVSGAASIPSVDQLALAVSGTVVFEGKTPMPARTASLPLTTAVLFPDVSGPVRIEVTGLVSDTPVGTGHVDVTVSPGFHQVVGVYLGEGEDAGAQLDLSPPVVSDGGGAVDSGPPDLAPPARHVFLLSARPGNLGDRATVARACDGEAHAPPGSYQPVLSFYPNWQPPQGPTSYLKLSGARPITLMDGTLVATDGTFFGPHLSPINELANGQHIGTTGAPCVWTSFHADGTPSQYACNNWTTTFYQSSGADGDPNGDPIAYPTRWAETGTPEPCNRYCHVYCLEYP